MILLELVVNKICPLGVAGGEKMRIVLTKLSSKLELKLERSLATNSVCSWENQEVN